MMTSFIFSAGLGFVIYELLAFTHIPEPLGTYRDYRFFFGTRVRFDDEIARRLAIGFRFLIVVVVLYTIVLIHRWLAPYDPISAISVNVYLGFLFGPLLAIWVNELVRHDVHKPLSRGYILAAIGLALLFIVGSVGDESAKIVRHYANSLREVKFGDTQISFADKKRGDPGSTPPAGVQHSYAAGGSNGLTYIGYLAKTIAQDKKYLKLLKPNLAESQTAAMIQAENLADEVLQVPLSCLQAESATTADVDVVNKHLGTFADALRQLALLRSSETTTPEQGLDAAPVREVSKDFVQSSLGIAYDAAASEDQGVVNACGKLLYFFPNCRGYVERAPVQTGSQVSYKYAIKDRPQLSVCLRRLRGALANPGQNADVPEDVITQANAQIDDLKTKLWEFLQNDGVHRRPYFAMARAGIMAQLGHYAAAGAILDGWLAQQRGRRFTSEDDESFVQSWFTFRARVTLGAFMEEWLNKEGEKATTSVRQEHLSNLNDLRASLLRTLKNVDFFKAMDKPCDERCDIVLREPRPGACASSLPPEQLDEWRKLFTSYVSVEFTYIGQAIRHPRYKETLLASTDLAARRLVNFDVSCGTEKNPTPAELYAQVLAAFVQNQISIVRALGTGDSSDRNDKRLADADRAAKLGVEIASLQAVRDALETHRKNFAERIDQGVAGSMVELLQGLRSETEQIKKNQD